MENASLQRITTLNALDYGVLGLGILALLGVAWYVGRGEKDTNDFFLGRRHIPWWAACLSFIATEISALTIVGVPATAYAENWQYLQFFIGSAAARLTIAFLFIPAFYKYNVTSIYEFLGHRFSPGTQIAGSIFFFITRLIASGVRLYAASMAISLILGWDLKAALVLFSVISILYIGYGGIKAVIWTNVVQATTFILAGVAVAVYLFSQIPGGFSEIFRVAGEGKRLKLINLSGSLADPTTLWIATLNGFFGSAAAFGTDQELMQRLLTVDTRKNSQRTMVTTIAFGLPVTALFLSVGTLLYVFYQTHAASVQPEDVKKVLSWFTVHELPNGLKGLMLTAIVMASIDSPLSSLTSSFITDIYKPVLKPGATEKHYMWAARAAIVVFGVILAFIAYQCDGLKNLLWFAFSINGVTAGSLLGIFFLGLLTTRKSARGAIWGMILSSLTTGTLLMLIEYYKVLDLGWSWLIVIGTFLSFALGWVFGSKEK